MPIRAKYAGLAIGLLLLAFAGAATSQQVTGGVDSEYVARAMTAAPPDIAQDATIVRMVNGTMQTVKKGTNEFTCMVANTGPMCMAPIAMEWAHAWQTHSPATDKTGFIYMLAGNTGASNTDPYAKAKTADNHWIQTASHVMIVVPAKSVRKRTFKKGAGVSGEGGALLVAGGGLRLCGSLRLLLCVDCAFGHADNGLFLFMAGDHRRE